MKTKIRVKEGCSIIYGWWRNAGEEFMADLNNHNIKNQRNKFNIVDPNILAKKDIENKQMEKKSVNDRMMATSGYKTK